jgi:hypothetical protein
MSSSVVTFLKGIALKRKHAVFDAMFGEIRLGREFPITQSSGAVYGIWVKAKKSSKFECSPVPGHPDWHPVYWGKDIAPMSRMKAHVQGHKNGNVNLPSIRELQGHQLIFGGILVARYREFEAMLHHDYPPLRGSSARGRVSTVVHIND